MEKLRTCLGVNENHRPDPPATCASDWACPAVKAWPLGPCNRIPVQDRWPAVKSHATARTGCSCSHPNGKSRPGVPCFAPLRSFRTRSWPDWLLASATRTCSDVSVRCPVASVRRSSRSDLRCSWNGSALHDLHAGSRRWSAGRKHFQPPNDWPFRWPLNLLIRTVIRPPETHRLPSGNRPPVHNNAKNSSIDRIIRCIRWPGIEIKQGPITGWKYCHLWPM
jgi:hypothetical protein